VTVSNDVLTLKGRAVAAASVCVGDRLLWFAREGGFKLFHCPSPGKDAGIEPVSLRAGSSPPSTLNRAAETWLKSMLLRCRGHCPARSGSQRALGTFLSWGESVSQPSRFARKCEPLGNLPGNQNLWVKDWPGVGGMGSALRRSACSPSC